MTTATPIDLYEAERAYQGIAEAIRPVLAAEWFRNHADDGLVGRYDKGDWLAELENAANIAHGKLSGLANTLGAMQPEAQDDLYEATLLLGAVEVLSERSLSGADENHAQKADDALYLIVRMLRDYQDVEGKLKALEEARQPAAV